MGWKKVIVSGSSADLLNVSASAGFKGNLVGNATTATTATQVGNSLTVDNSTIQLNSGTTYNGSGARTISIKNNGVTLAKIASQANNTILGNVSGEAAEPSALSAANVLTMIGVESGADVTDTANVTSAGALMDSELAEIGTVKALTKAGISGSLSANALAGLGAGLVSSSAQVSALGGVQDSTITITAGNGLSGGGSFTVNTGSNGSISLAVGVDDSTIELSGDAVRVKDSGITLAKQANMAADRIQGRANGAGAGAPQALTAAQVRTIISVEQDADVTDTENVTSAGALMDSEVASLALVKALTAAGISGSFGAASASFSTRVTANDAKLTANTSNVTSAGALMDSELTSIADVKALDQSVIAGAAPEFATTNMTDASNKRFMSDAQETKLDSVESNADVTDTANVTSAGALMDSELADLAAVKAINQGLTTTSNVSFGNVTLSGDLVVNGTTTTLNTTNLNVEDQFILVNSGSTAKDAGIVFGGTSGTNQQGKAIIWDYSYNGNDGRLAVSTTDVAHNSTSNFSAGTTGYYVAGVFQGNSDDAATAKADHAGNIRIESNEIYIYV